MSSSGPRLIAIGLTAKATDTIPAARDGDVPRRGRHTTWRVWPEIRTLPARAQHWMPARVNESQEVTHVALDTDRLEDRRRNALFIAFLYTNRVRDSVISVTMPV